MDEQLIKEKEQIIRDFGLEIEKVEDSVYKVLNTDKEFNIDKLQWALEECVTITSTETHYHKEPDGFYTSEGIIYYVVIEHNVDLAYKYYYKAEEDFGSALYLSYKYNPDHYEDIPTLYLPEELEFLEQINKEQQSE